MLLPRKLKYWRTAGSGPLFNKMLGLNARSKLHVFRILGQLWDIQWFPGKKKTLGGINQAYKTISSDLVPLRICNWCTVGWTRRPHLLRKTIATKIDVFLQNFRRCSSGTYLITNIWITVLNCFQNKNIWWGKLELKCRK